MEWMKHIPQKEILLWLNWKVDGLLMTVGISRTEWRLALWSLKRNTLVLRMEKLEGIPYLGNLLKVRTKQKLAKVSAPKGRVRKLLLPRTKLKKWFIASSRRRVLKNKRKTRIRWTSWTKLKMCLIRRKNKSNFTLSSIERRLIHKEWNY